MFRALLLFLLLLGQPAVAAQVAVGGDDLIIGSSEAVNRPMPATLGEPMTVRTALAFVAVDSLDEQAETFHATVDLRLEWVDPKLARPGKRGKQTEYSDWAAGQQLFAMWSPRIRLANIDGRPTFKRRQLTISPDGTVVVLTRLSADFNASVDIARYPFDRQTLSVTVTAYGDEASALQLTYSAQDKKFTAADPTEDLDGWAYEGATLSNGLEKGWDNHSYSQVIASIQVKRASIEAIIALCLPLLASLLIPFLVIWLNRSDEEEFEVEAFELANVVIGGLFAVIALSITISSSNTALVVKDNVVSRLLMLNYASLGFGMIVVLFLYQFRVIGKWFGARAQRWVHLALCWGYPTATAAIAALILTGPLRA